MESDVNVAAEPPTAAPDRCEPEISVIVPTRRGGPLLERAVVEILRQRCPRPSELLLVDSGSEAGELERLRRLGARVEVIPPERFDHGETRDLGARLGRGRVLVFLNQDAVPVDDGWLGRLTAPLFGDDPPAAVQGGIRELPDAELAAAGRRRFFWDSCGPRFYFTSESEEWIARHDGIGFSTVNCALSRSAWERIPFGRAAILEDKRWQKRAAEVGLRIVAASDAAVWHTHDYGLRSLARRCVSEGFGWRLVGERYPLGRALRDLGRRTVWREWRRGIRSGRARRPAEVLFPVLRPFALWWGNRWARRVLH